MSTEVTCEYCNHTLKNILMLNKHQRLSKYCLVTQGKIEDKKKLKKEQKERIESEKEKEREIKRKEKEQVKEKIESEKEKKKANQFICDYCKVKFSSKNSLFGHLDICLDKYKKIIEDKEKIIEENKQIIQSTALLPAAPRSHPSEEEAAPRLPLKENTLSISPKKPLVLNDITIEVNPVSLMINATQMCKAAGKLFADYQRLSGTKDYLQALESNMGIPILELIKVDVGGNHSGTWVHRLVAVHLAQWLSPSFAVQVSLWVKSLEDHNDLLIDENKRLNSINRLCIENKKIKENNLSISPKKPLVLNDMTIEVNPVSLMINATQMCKAAGKLFGHYRSLDSTQTYLQTLESIIGIPILELIKVDVGGNSKEQGTWVHRLVAVHLAQWLSPSFAVQTNATLVPIDIAPPCCTNTNGAEIVEFVLKLSNGTDFIVPVRRDGYVNVTKICQAAGKRLQHYKDGVDNKHFLDRFVALTGISANAIFKVVQGGNIANVEQGTFAHPDIAIHIAQWCSADFSIQVSRWVRQLMTTGRVELGNEMRTNQLDNEYKKKIEDLTGAVCEEKEKYMQEANRCKDLELTINRIEEDKIKKEEYEKKKIIDNLNTAISVFSTETKSNLNFHEEKEVIYLGYIGNFLFKYGQSSSFKDRLGTHEKSTSYEKFEIVKVFACKNPVVSERRVREWVRKNKLEYEYKPDGEAARGQREIIKIESKEMLERVCKAMHKYSNFNINKMSEVEVDIKRIEADKEVNIKKIESEIEIKRLEIEIKKTEAEVEMKKIDLLAGGKITFEQYIELKNLK